MVTAVSEIEAKEFEAHGCSQIQLLSHSTDFTSTSPKFEDRKNLLFVGTVFGDGGPNFDAMNWFCSEIMPCLRTLGCSHSLLMLGFNQSSRLRSYEGEDVKIIGAVESLTPWYDASLVFVAPTRFSAGIPLKVVEAVARGLPAVVTTLLAEQLGWDPADKRFVASTALEFAHQVQALATDAVLWNAVRQEQSTNLQQKYSREAFRNQLLSVLRTMNAEGSN